MLGLSPNGKLVLQSTYPTFMKTFFENEDDFHFITRGLFYYIPVFIVPA